MKMYVWDRGASGGVAVLAESAVQAEDLVAAQYPEGFGRYHALPICTDFLEYEPGEIVEIGLS